LAAIIVAIVVVGGIAFGGVQFYRWYRQGHEAAVIEAAAAQLETARDLVGQGHGTEAKALLEPLVAQVHDETITPEALALLAAIERDAGRPDAALALLEQAREGFPASAGRPHIALAHARLLEDTGRTEQARAVYASVRAETSAAVRAPALMGLGRAAERANDVVEARETYRQALQEAAWDSPAWKEALDAIGRVNVALVFCATPTPEGKVYEVQPGDNLTNIGVRLNTTQGLLTRANGIRQHA